MQKPGWMPSFWTRGLPEWPAIGARRLRLRLRLQAGIRIGARPRLAGRRHRRGARGRGLQHRLAVRLLALQQVLNLVAGQRLEFKQALGQRFQVGALLGEDPRRFVVALLDKTPDLAVDLLNRRFRGVLGPRYRHAEEHL